MPLGCVPFPARLLSFSVSNPGEPACAVPAGIPLLCLSPPGAAGAPPVSAPSCLRVGERGAHQQLQHRAPAVPVRQGVPQAGLHGAAALCPLPGHVPVPLPSFSRTCSFSPGPAVLLGPAVWCFPFATPTLLNSKCCGAAVPRRDCYHRSLLFLQPLFGRARPWTALG